MGRDLTSLYISASFAGLTQISGSILTDGTGSNIDNLTITASNATSASHADISDFAFTATSASFATTALLATSASHAVSSDTAISASHALIANVASYAATANSASHAVNADSAISASYATNSGTSGNGFPYTGSAEITGSLKVIGDIQTSGSLIIGDGSVGWRQINIENPGYTNTPATDSNNDRTILVGSSNAVNKGGDIAIGLSNNTGLHANGQFNVVLGNTNTINNGNFRSNNYLIGYSNNISVDGNGRMVMSYDSNMSLATGSYGGIFGGYQNNAGHAYSVVIGGNGLNTTKDNEVVVPNLTLSGSGVGITFADGTIQTTAGGGSINTGSFYVSSSVSDATITFTQGDGSTEAVVVNNVNNAISASYAVTASYAENAGGGAGFPYTGSAEITGSLVVTGSIGGLLADNEGINIFASASANSTNGSILIGAQIPSQNNYNTNIGIGNIVIGSGEWLVDASGVLNGAGDFNTVIGGYSGGVNTGLYNIVMAGGNNFIGVSGSGIANTNTRYNVIIGGENHIIEDRANYNGIFAGRGNVMAPIGTNSNQYSTLIGGQNNHISSSDWSVILGGNSHQMEFANYSGILAGNNHTFTYGANTNAYSAMVGGNGNTNAHVRSVVIGGTGLTTTADDQVVVPDLLVTGSNGITFPDGTSQTTAAGAAFPYTGSAEITGSLDVTGIVELLDTTANAYGINIGVIGQARNYVSGNPGSPGVAIGYGNGTTGNFNQHFIIGKNNTHNFQGNGATSYIFGQNNTLGGNANQYNVIIGHNHSMASDARYSIFAGGDSHQLSGNNSRYSGILAGLNNTLAHSQSVILGGDNITTTAHNTTFVPNLCLTGSSATLTFGDGTTQTTAAIAPFPYTGSAIISGSLSVTGSIGVQSGSFNGFVIDNLTTPTASEAISHIVALSTAEYAAITPDNNTYYVITDSSGATVLENTVVSGSLVGEVSALSIASTTASMDCSAGNFYTLTLANGVDTHFTATNVQAGQTINVKLTNNATAAGTISFNTSIFKFEGGTPFTATAATNAVDVMTFISFDGSTLQATGLKNFS